MELIFKLPPGKPPFIGIRFKESELRQACMLNQELVSSHLQYKYTAQIDLRVNLKY
jgi:hypothetical protein